jgi:hypothetical protein
MRPGPVEWALEVNVLVRNAARHAQRIWIFLCAWRTATIAVAFR